MDITRVARFSRFTLVLGVLLAPAVLPGTTLPLNSRDVSLESLRQLFTQPPRQFSCAPFWVWNDDLTTDLVQQTLGDLRGQNIREVIVHPRPGLMTPYLGNTWFDLWDLALKEAARLDMNVWIYDENSYPSGFAGGFVPEAMPDSAAVGLDVRQEKTCPKPDDRIVAVFAVHANQSCDDITSAVLAGHAAAGSDFLVFLRTQPERSSWFAGWNYVDILKQGVTGKFLELTLEPYRKRYGDLFGTRIPGVFTDEPNIDRARGKFPWTADLPEAFRKRWGYDLVAHLPDLVRDTPDSFRVRHNFYQVLLELFVDRWCKPYHEYCENNRLELTGHYWEHSWPKCNGCPDNMAFAAWQQRPGIDQLFNSYGEGPHAQFGNVRMVREIGSVANQLGMARTLCETYGGFGWDLDFQSMKRISDWLYALGINTINQHLSYVSARGARKRDYPPSFSYHAPWWQSYKLMADRLARLAVATSHGEQENSILVLEPTSTAWMYHGTPSQGDALKRVGDEFQKIVVALEKAQVESDIGCEDIIARHGTVEFDPFLRRAALQVGRRVYRTIVITPGTANVNRRTAGLLAQYVAQGGSVVCCDEPPSRVDGATTDTVAQLASASSWKRVQPEALPAVLLEGGGAKCQIRRNSGDGAILYHQRRELRDGQLLFLVNTSADRGTSGTIACAGRSVEAWNPDCGKTELLPFLALGDGTVETTFDLPPCGSVVLAFSEATRQTPSEPAEPTRRAVSASLTAVRADDMNVLRLDYLDLEAGDSKTTSQYFLDAQARAFKAHGIDQNPWHHAIQFRDQWISRKFPETSGFTASYHFVLADPLPERLFFAAERPDLYSITCNGRKVTAKPGDWWLDRSMGKLDIRREARPGTNTVTLVARPFTVYHEIEAAFLLGDFSLEPVAAGFVAHGKPRPLELGSWDKQGWPFYGGTVTYTSQFHVPERGGRYYVELPDWSGAVADIRVNGRDAGQIYCAPWRCAVTRNVQEGTNTLEVRVTGTLRNTLGPHFAKPGAHGPGPGKTYDVKPYGLFEKPGVVIEQVRGLE